MSRPYALPVAPTRLADNRTSIPPPEPRSRTDSPSWRSASAVGLPQPSEASTAPSGKPLVCEASYRLSLTHRCLPGSRFESITTREFTATGVFAGLHGLRVRRDLVERLSLEVVVHPPAIAPIRQQAGILQHLEVEREPGLCDTEHLLELAHTAFFV